MIEVGNKTSAQLPEHIETESELEEILTRPGAELVRFIKTIPSPLLILGAGGKMGPTVAIMARRAAEAAGHSLQVIAASRFNDGRARDCLERHGVQTISCDLLKPDSLENLPDAGNVIHLVGMKFGTGKAPPPPGRSTSSFRCGWRNGIRVPASWLFRPAMSIH